MCQNHVEGRSFALQITLVDFTPFMWAAGFASLAGIDQPDFVPTLLCACFFCMGICTFLQTTVGNRLPIVQDPLPHLCHPWETLQLFTVCQQCGSLADWRFDSDNPRNYKDSKQGKSFPSSVVVGSVVTAIGFVAARIAVQWTFSRQEPLYLVLALISFCWRLY